MPHTDPDPTDLRVEILRHWRQPHYILAAQVHVHPCTLSSMLHGRLPMPTAVKQRILLVLSSTNAVPIQRLARAAEVSGR